MQAATAAFTRWFGLRRRRRSRPAHEIHAQCRHRLHLIAAPDRAQDANAWVGVSGGVRVSKRFKRTAATNPCPRCRQKLLRPPRRVCATFHVSLNPSGVVPVDLVEPGSSREECGRKSFASPETFSHAGCRVNSRNVEWARTLAVVVGLNVVTNSVDLRRGCPLAIGKRCFRGLVGIASQRAVESSHLLDVLPID